MKRICIILLVLAAACLCAGAQNVRKVTGTPMEYIVDSNGDTTFVATLDPAWVLPRGQKMKGRDWRRYYRLVYNFNKVYPYALVGRKLLSQVDSTIAADVTRRSQRTRYINDVEKELFRLFERDIRTYESGFAANFWQLVARLFSQNLKTRYDPTQGEDAQIEELCGIWDSGRWDDFYFSIFYEMPEKTEISGTTLESEVRKRNR